MPLRREILKQRGAEVAKQEISVSKQILSYEEIGCKWLLVLSSKAQLKGYYRDW